MPEKPNKLISSAFLFILVVQCTPGFAQRPSDRITSSTVAIQITTSFIPSTCGQRNGILLASATGGTPPYTYSFNGEPFQSSALTLVTGSSTYSIAVKDAIGATASTAAIVTNTFNPVTISILSAAQPSGYNTPDGSVALQALHGTPPYTYSVNGIIWQPYNTFTGLYTGVYTFYVKDANGCVDYIHYWSGTFKFYENNFIGSWSPFCCTNEGHIDLTLNNGVDHTYSLDGIHFQSSYHFTGLHPAGYMLYIRDADGTIHHFMICILQQCSFTVIGTVINASCGNSDGSIEATATNGTPPYQYSIDGMNFQSSPVFAGLSPGNFTLVAKDATGLITTTPITTITNVCIALNLAVTDATCGNSNGTITATASNGTAPYTYSIDGVNFQSNAVFSGLSQGNYTVTVKDASGFSITGPVSVGNIEGPQIITGSVAASCANNDGSITTSGTGGTVPFSYAINNSGFQNSGNFTHLSTGNYIATIKDANGCITSQPVSVDLSNTLTVDAGTGITITEGETATIKASSNGISFSWAPVTGLNDAAVLSPEASPDSTTTYFVTAHWGVCENKDSMLLIVNPAPAATFFVPNAFTPNGDGHNDVFKAKPAGIRQFKYFAVYNRWGQRVFYTNNPRAGWDGAINGKMVQPGTYVWMAAGIDFRKNIVERKGIVVLIR